MAQSWYMFARNPYGRPPGFGFRGSYGMGGQPIGWGGGERGGGPLPNGFYSGGGMPRGYYGGIININIIEQNIAAYNAATAAKTGPVTVTPPAFRVSWDTIGQVIYRAFGNVRLPMMTIWCQGIIYPMEVEGPISPKLTFAAAICAPIDPAETGQVNVLFSGNSVIYDTSKGGVQIPDGLSVEDAAALQLSLQNAVVYPGDESQAPAPLIVADRGASVTNAFRGIRYIILPLYPLIEGFGSLSMIWGRTGGTPTEYTSYAVEFEAGAT